MPKHYSVTALHDTTDEVIVEYEHKFIPCTICKVFAHSDNNCLKFPCQEWRPKNNTLSKIDSQSTRGRDSLQSFTLQNQYSLLAGVLEELVGQTDTEMQASSSTSSLSLHVPVNHVVEPQVTIIQNSEDIIGEKCRQFQYSNTMRC